MSFWDLLRTLLAKIPSLEGIRLAPADYPKLFAEMNELRELMDIPEVEDAVGVRCCTPRRNHIRFFPPRSSSASLRRCFGALSNPDCVMALALIHHLLVSANMSLDAISEQLYEMTNRDLILEFVPTDDNMFERLMNYRVDLFQDINLESCLAAFESRFELLEQHPVTGSKRTLLFFRKRN